MGIALRTTQNQKISQSIIQQVTILQMNSLELSDYIKELSLENPLMEMEPENGDVDAENRMRLKKLEWLSEFDEQNRGYERDTEEAEEFPEQSRAEENLLEDVLMMQIPGYVQEGDRRILEYMIHCLDQRGYFTESASETAAHFRTSEEHIGYCLGILKSMEPAGIGAGNLEECLLLQLDRMEDRDAYDVEREIVKHHLEALGKHYLEQMAKKLGVTVGRIRQAADVIKTLNPKPANGYGQRSNVQYVKPDVVVTCIGGSMEIKIDEYSYPSLRINRDYMRMLRAQECGPEVQRYISGKARQIEMVQGYIRKRYETLYRLTGFLTEHQEEFFRKGPGYLKPLKMQAMADYMGVHESTVSRAVREKYLQCAWGIFPLEYFFSKTGFEGQNARIFAPDQVKAMLGELIEKEDKKKPLSDQKLAGLMNEQGIAISRRTVAKYREEMGLPDCRGRKMFA